MNQPKSSLVLITPKLAKEMLAMNTQNRSTSPSRVNRIRQSIKNGKFIVTNNAIGFDVNGVLTDGQTRLQAIIDADESVLSFVTTDLPPQARLVVDTGRIRSHANSLQMLGLGKVMVTIDGVEKEKDCTKLLASVSAYIMLDRLGLFNMVQAFGHILTNDEVADFVAVNKNELIKNATKVSGAKFNTKDLLGLSIDASNRYMAQEEMSAKKKLVGRPNGSNLVTVKLQGELNDKANEFFGAVKLEDKLVIE